MNRLRQYTFCVTLALLPIKSYAHSHHAHVHSHEHRVHHSVISRAPEPEVETSVASNDILVEESDASTLAKEFSIKESFAKQVLTLAHKYAYRDFPKATDILGVIAIESRFNPKAQSRSATGIMQLASTNGRVRDVEANIKKGVEILRNNYLTFRHNRKAAIISYNIGEGAYQKGRRNVKYLALVNERTRWFDDEVVSDPIQGYLVAR